MGPGAILTFVLNNESPLMHNRHGFAHEVAGLRQKVQLVKQLARSLASLG